MIVVEEILTERHGSTMSLLHDQSIRLGSRQHCNGPPIHLNGLTTTEDAIDAKGPTMKSDLADQTRYLLEK